MTTLQLAGATVSIAATTTADSGTIPSAPATVRLFNDGLAVAYVSFDGDATTASFPIGAGESILIDKGRATAVSAITAAETTTVCVTPVFVR